MFEDDLTADRQLARTLRRTWPAFFQRFGRLTPVQRMAMPAILKGKDVLVCAATASGKTEAAAAPLIERLMDRSRWTLLYVSPTRALINDLYGRLQRPLEMLGVALERRTGEYASTMRTARGKAEVLLTTPESFDSLLCRGRQGEDHRLAHVAALVLDEVHLLYGTARGEQVRWLIERLRRLRQMALRKNWTLQSDLQIVALSATVAEPHAVVEQFLPGGETIVVPGARSIQVVDDSEVTAERTETRLVRYLSTRNRPEKVLVFCDQRKRVDLLVHELKARLEPLGYKVLAHHGALAKEVREAAEAAMARENKVVLVATSTLEIGIDIGDVDLVVLDGPPPNVASLLQRIGRGNRRSGETRVLCGAASDFDLLICRAMLEAARRGRLARETIGPEFAVARQQVVSYIYQAPGHRRPIDKVQAFLKKMADPIVAAHLLLHMIGKGELVISDGKIRLSDRLFDAAERGMFHSNIQRDNEPGYEIVSAEDGKLIAREIRLKGGDRVIVGGKEYRLAGNEGRRMKVTASDDEGSKTSSPIVSEHAAFEMWDYVSLSDLRLRDWADTLRWYFDVPEDVWPIVVEKDRSYVFHFGGKRGALAFELIEKALGERTPWTGIHEYLIVFPGYVTGKPSVLDRLAASDLEQMLPGNVNRLAKELGRRQALNGLPEVLKLEEVRRWLGLDKQVSAIRRSVWQMADGALKRNLHQLVSYFDN